MIHLVVGLLLVAAGIAVGLLSRDALNGLPFVALGLVALDRSAGNRGATLALVEAATAALSRGEPPPQ